MIDKVAECGFPVGKFELEWMIKDMVTKNVIFTERGLGMPMLSLLKKFFFPQLAWTNSM